MSGNGSVIVFKSGAEVGSVLYPFATRGELRENFTVEDRRASVSLDQKCLSVANAHGELIRMLSLDTAEEGSEQEVIWQDDSVFAHVPSTVVRTCAARPGCFCFHPPGSHTVLVWNLTTGEAVPRFEHDRPVTCVQ
eukprot:1034872-Rhodomonas_salina.1